MRQKEKKNWRREEQEFADLGQFRVVVVVEDEEEEEEILNKKNAQIKL